MMQYASILLYGASNGASIPVSLLGTNDDETTDAEIDADELEELLGEREYDRETEPRTKPKGDIETEDGERFR